MCDFCSEEGNTWEPCLSCGKHFCFACAKTKAVTYENAIFFLCSNDGRYCLECDEAQKNTSLHRAYKAVQRLRCEIKEWSKDFRRRGDFAEAELKKLLDERKKH
jgi:hypothetical protein